MIEKYIHEEVGYNPCFIYGGWQVALLNYSGKQGMDDIEKIDIHFDTDEVFVLLKGKAILISATKEGDELSFACERMKPCVVYNIPRMTWHNIALSEDAQVAIIENAGTHLADFDFYYLSDGQKRELYDCIAKTFK